MNNAGDVAAVAYTDLNSPRGVIYRDGNLIDLSALAGAGPSTALAINNPGH